VDLYRQGYASILVLTGGDARVFGTGPREAVEVTRLAIRLGVPESATMINTEARNSYGNATGTKRLLRLASILLVSSASPLPRAVPVFTKQGLRVTPVPSDYISQDLSRESWDDIDLFDILPNENAFQNTREQWWKWRDGDLWAGRGL
jgi:uncharacterized SAM-binding protein YcdF (DUF218 family)